MPGAIQVSVLGLMGLPPSAHSSWASSSEECFSSGFSLKMAMGKTEYQTGGKGDFSFPVTSLHENLRLTLHDADGKEISRTDVKTMVIVEKRNWDALFPLEGGGCVHLKLQFILNAEEHKRIREMREAVLKRTHDALLKNVFKDSVADRRGESLLASLPQELQSQPEDQDEQDAIHQSEANGEQLGTKANRIDTHEINASLEGTLDPQLGHSGSLVSKEITAASHSSSAVAQGRNLISTRNESVHENPPVSNIKKMISAFETISVQEPRIHVGSTTESWMRRVNRESSLGAPGLDEMNNENLTNQKMMLKSFLMGAPPQVKLAQLDLMHAKAQDEKQPDLAIDKKNLGNNKQSTVPKNAQNHEKIDSGNKKAVSEFLYSTTTKSPSCEITDNTIDTIETKEVVTFYRSTDIIKNVDQCPSYETSESPSVMFEFKEHDAFGKKVVLGSFPEGVSFQDSKASYNNSDVTTSHCFEKEWNTLGSERHLLHKVNNAKSKMVDSPSVCGQQACGYLESPDGRASVHTKEIRKNEGVFKKMVAEPAITEQAEQPCNSSMYEGHLKPIVKAESGFNSARHDVFSNARHGFYELSMCGSSDVKLDVSTYFDVEQCLLGGFIPRHLCITSGSKELKEFVGGFTSI